MKMLFCKKCHDAIKLRKDIWVYCECFSCRGRYLSDGLCAEVDGETGAVLCVSNSDVKHALLMEEQEKDIEAWMMFQDSARITFQKHTLKP